jgi:heme/copper-type cytochrome/quinol oxidase subunit 2
MRNALLVVVAAVVVVFGFVLARDTSDKQDNTTGASPSTAPAVATTAAGRSTVPNATAPTASAPAGPPHIVVQGGKPKGGVQDLTFTKGDRIRFAVTSDVADEIHVHGFDVHKDVRKGGTVTFSFPAKFDGRFEVELEGRKQQIAELTVNP